MPEYFIQPGHLCCVRISEDKWWYRVIIHRILGKKEVEVFYPDFGNIGTVQKSSLRFLKWVDVTSTGKGRIRMVELWPLPLAIFHLFFFTSLLYDSWLFQIFLNIYLYKLCVYICSQVHTGPKLQASRCCGLPGAAGFPVLHLQVAVSVLMWELGSELCPLNWAHH